MSSSTPKEGADPGRELAGSRALVTGAAGFIGGRLVERLAESEVEVRAFVHRLSRASRIAVYPLELIDGDVRDAGTVVRAAEDCDLIFHCAYGTGGSQRLRSKVNVEGTANVLDAARKHEVSRVVHLSSLVVYGHTEDGDLDESAPRRSMGDAYSSSKLAAERRALRAADRGLPVAVLQPTTVYGPFGGVWTANVLQSLASGRVILVDGGQGLANPVYVDDLVEAMLLAAVRPGAVGEAFLISSAEEVTWRELYEGFAELLELEDRTVEMTEDEAISHFRRQRWKGPGLISRGLSLLRKDEDLRDRLLATREGRLVRWAGSTLIPQSWQPRIKSWLKALAGKGGTKESGSSAGSELPIHPTPPGMVRFLSARTRVRIDKARRVLGFEPRYDFEAGMARTGAWARWAGMAPSEEERPPGWEPPWDRD
ncbi:MAG: NAD-dependent epimerase/dehydratase family protein [Thermoanaerobaculia bacterium]|nr:NAD-dependent epimerase/dehydratase family protein [Thermoanaerobaculia bacterium]